ncbi:DUF943 family protein [Pantoea sp. A4]|uniref:DUF943 family protein n=1 Tax=Pantoea sp. A4 TaxID=1225184 RepID=UPI0003663A99|nr:DUF943 family protein [Pantoea sp. A4]
MKRACIPVLVLMIAAILTFGYLEIRSTEIVNVDQNGHTAQIIVDHLPWTDSRRIAWWEANSAKIISKYDIHPENSAYFIFAFGDGYKKEEKADRLCLSNVPAPVNCIEKETLLIVMPERNQSTLFIIANRVYRQDKNGKIVREEQ